MGSARHVIKRMLDHRSLSQIASYYDVACTIHQSLRGGGAQRWGGRLGGGRRGVGCQLGDDEQWQRCRW
jgi:hypothetical protein